MQAQTQGQILALCPSEKSPCLTFGQTYFVYYNTEKNCPNRPISFLNALESPFLGLALLTEGRGFMEVAKRIWTAKV